MASTPSSASETRSKKKNYTPLQPWEEKRLIADIESAGGFGSFDFLQTCNRDSRIFGAPGSDLRYSFQQTKNRLKKRLPSSYLQLVESLGIEPSDDTRLRAARAPIGSPSNNTASTASPSTPSQPKMADEDQLSYALQDNLNLEDADDADAETQSFSSANQDLALPSFIQTTNSAPNFLGGSRSTSTSTSTRGALVANGSKELPFIVMVNPTQPERHGHFVVERIKNMKIHDDKTTRNVWEIKLLIADGRDIDLYDAIDTGTAGSGPNRQHWIRINTPSVSKCLLEAGLFNTDIEEKCETTADQRKSTALEISGNKSRMKDHYCFLFPQGITLDNSVFGKDGKLFRQHVPILRSFGSEHLLMDCLVWKIAEKGHRETEDTNESIDLIAERAKRIARFQATQQP